MSVLPSSSFNIKGKSDGVGQLYTSRRKLIFLSTILHDLSPDLKSCLRNIWLKQLNLRHYNLLQRQIKATNEEKEHSVVLLMKLLIYVTSIIPGY